MHKKANADPFRRNRTRYRGITYRERADGSRQYSVYWRGKYLSVEGGEADALAKQADLRGKSARGERVVTPTKTTFGEVAEQWFESKHRLRAGTRNAYRRGSEDEETVPLVHETTARGTRLPFVTISPESYTALRQDAANLLDFAREYVSRFVWLSQPEQYDTLALWTLHTWAFEAAETTPYLHVTAPEREAGKTRVLEVLKVLVRNGWKVGGITAASLYRKIDAEYVTLLFDEGDNLFSRNAEYVAAINGLLNDGYRRGGVYSLAVPSGNDYVQRDFEVFCPKAIAGIGHLPDTVASRSIRFDMKGTMSDRR
jgi:hypothetical protein